MTAKAKEWGSQMKAPSCQCEGFAAASCDPFHCVEKEKEIKENLWCSIEISENGVCGQDLEGSEEKREGEGEREPF